MYQNLKISYSPDQNYKFGKKLRNNRQVRLDGLAMGGKYSVVIVVDKEQDIETISDQIDERLNQIEQQMTMFDDQSNLMRFNMSSVGEWVRIPDEFYDNICVSKQLMNTTNNSVNIFLANEVEQWGFARNKRRFGIEDKSFEQHNARQFDDLIELNPYIKAIRKKLPCQITLNSIAKGYGADYVASYLNQIGVENYLIEVSGEMVAKGSRLDGSPWRVAIEKPIPGVSECHQVIELNDGAIATSGDYRKFFKKNDQIFSHIIHPNFGKPIFGDLASVTVYHEKAAIADGYATALMVMGATKAKKFAQRQNLSVLFIYRTANYFETEVLGSFVDLIKA